MITHDIDQRSDEWFKVRLGKWTASNFSKCITNTGKTSTQADAINNRLAAELFMGEPANDGYTNDTMERGKEMEAEAMSFLNFSGYEFENVGFCESNQHDETGDGFGCSPDGINTKDEIGLELKCPLAHTHVGYLVKGELPSQYKAQVQGSMLVTGFKRWLFVSYFPGLPPLILTVECDEEYIEKLKSELLENCGIVKQRLNSFFCGW